MLFDLDVEILRWLVAVRSPALDRFFLFVTDLGSTVGYLVLLPLVWWGVSWKLGARVFVALVLSVYLNALVKDAVASPRPFLYTDFVSLRSPEEFSFPSGHAQNAAVVWGLLALHFRTRWFTLAAAAVVLLVGVSRVYLAVHFPNDVLAGWILGGGFALGFARWSAGIAERAKRLSIGARMSLAIGGPALLAIVHSTPNVASALGGLAGALSGLGYAHHRGLYPKGAESRSRRAWLLVGLAGLPMVYIVLRSLSPGAGSSWYEAHLFARFAGIGLWVSFLVPTIVDLVKRRRSGLESVE